MRAKNSKGNFSALVPVLRYAASSSWSFILLLLAGACNGHSPRVAIEAAGLEQVAIQAQAQVLESEVKEEPVASDYRFGDNVLNFKLRDYPCTVQGRGKILHLSLGCNGQYTTLSFPTLSSKVIKYGSYNNNEALGLLEDEEYMLALWQALLGDNASQDETNDVGIATDLLNYTSHYIHQAAQKEAALVLETLVMLLRPSLRDTFIEYLEAVKEGILLLSTDVMNTFFSEKIPEKDSQYKFGDNVIEEYQRWDPSIKREKKFLSRYRQEVWARQGYDAPYISKKGIGLDYASLIASLVPIEEEPTIDKEGHAVKKQSVQRPILDKGAAVTLAKSLLNSKIEDCRFMRFTEVDFKAAQAMLEAIVGLAEEWRKQGASKLFRGCLRAIEAQEPGFTFNILAQADQGNIQPTEDSKQADQFRQCFKFAHAGKKKKSTNYPEGLPGTAEKFGLPTLTGPQHGRRQIARIKCIKEEKRKFDNEEENSYQELKDSLGVNFPEEHTLLFGNNEQGYLSSGDDYDSDEDTRRRKGRVILFIDEDVNDLFHKAGKQTGQTGPPASGAPSGS